MKLFITLIPMYTCIVYYTHVYLSIKMWIKDVHVRPPLTFAYRLLTITQYPINYPIKYNFTRLYQS